MACKNVLEKLHLPVSSNVQCSDAWHTIAAGAPKDTTAFASYGMK